MSYQQDEYHDYCGQCGWLWEDCECDFSDTHCKRCGRELEDCGCEFEYFSTGECSHCGEPYEDCTCHLIDDDGTEAEGVPFA